MPNYLQDQLITALTTVLSLLAAWSWNSVLQEYISQHYENTLWTRFLFALIITGVVFLLIVWILKRLGLHDETVEKYSRLP